MLMLMLMLLSVNMIMVGKEGRGARGAGVWGRTTMGEDKETRMRRVERTRMGREGLTLGIGLGSINNCFMVSSCHVRTLIACVEWSS
jgi:hypothetical protein